MIVVGLSQIAFFHSVGLDHLLPRGGFGSFSFMWRVRGDVWKEIVLCLGFCNILSNYCMSLLVILCYGTSLIVVCLSQIALFREEGSKGC